MPRRKTHEEFVAEVSEKYENGIIVIGNYKNTRTPIKIKHNIKNCNNEFYVKPLDIVNRNFNCPICRQRKYKEKFNKEFKKQSNGEYVMLSEYEKSTKSILIKHLKCKNEYMVKPLNFTVNGTRCPFCFGNKKRSHEEFVNIIRNLDENYIVLSKYKNANSYVTFRHNIDNCFHEFKMTPADFINNSHRCPKCAGVAKLSQDEFEKRVQELDPTYIVKSRYENSNTKVKLKHNIKECGYEFEVLPSNFIHSKSRCPKCSGRIGITYDEFIDKINALNDEYYVLSKRDEYGEFVELLHTPCKNIYKVRPYSFINQNSRCPKCMGERIANKLRKAHSQFVKEVHDLDSDYEVITPYKNAKTPLIIKHNIKSCGLEFKIKPNNFLNGRRCPYCAESKGEQRIRHWLESHNIDFEAQKEFEGLIGTGGGMLSYDFYLPDYNLLVEYQGQFHDGNGNDYIKQNLETQKEHDRRKREYAKLHGITLLEIWYWDFDNIENILENKLSELISETVQ